MGVRHIGSGAGGVGINLGFLSRRVVLQVGSVWTSPFRLIHDVWDWGGKGFGVRYLGFGSTQVDPSSMVFGTGKVRIGSLIFGKVSSVCFRLDLDMI